MKSPAPWSLSPEDWGQGLVRVVSEHQRTVDAVAELCFLWLNCVLTEAALSPLGLWLSRLIH